MIIKRIEDFKRGWFIGNFEPSLLKTNVEVAVMHKTKGTICPDHYHKHSTEYNVIVTGKLVVNGVTLTDGDIFVLHPYELSISEVLEDTTIVVFRDSSDSTDKYEVRIVKND